MWMVLGLSLFTSTSPFLGATASTGVIPHGPLEGEAAKPHQLTSPGTGQKTSARQGKGIAYFPRFPLFHTNMPQTCYFTYTYFAFLQIHLSLIA